ncbi:MAG: hypothetical protein QXG36_09605 [Nitrososphaeria archaeon]
MRTLLMKERSASSIIKQGCINMRQQNKDRVEQCSKEFSKLLKDFMPQAVVKVLLVGCAKEYMLG